jgi:hypothetical protein
MQRIKCGNPHHLPKKLRRGQHAPSPIRQQRMSSTVAQPAEPIEWARLTLHEADPITGNEDTLYTLFYEFNRGYTIFSTPEGRCCIHGRAGVPAPAGQVCLLPRY